MTSIVDTYSKVELQRLIANSSSFAEFLRKLGYTADSSKIRDFVRSKLQAQQVELYFKKEKTRKVKVRTDAEIFVNPTPTAQRVIRDHYKKGQYTEYKCSICGLLPYWQEKELTLILDHIDGNNKNCELQNLRWVCPNCNQQLSTTGSRNRKVKSKGACCMICGKPVHSHSTLRCKNCYNNYRKEIGNPSVLHFTKTELATLLLKYNFEELGRKYNVSGNAIRKWCIKFGLPYKYNDIKQFRCDNASSSKW